MRSLLGALAALAMALAILAIPARAEDDECAGFFSCVSPPKLPEVDWPTVPDLRFWREDAKKGRDAYRDGNDKKALKYFRKASEDGDIVADWYLGHMYRLGRGVQQSDATAFSYYVRVADQFNPDETNKKRLRVMVDGLVRTGDYYRLGSTDGTVPKDFGRALRIYKLASTYGHPAAEYGLGLMHLYGQGMKARPDLGLKWLFKSAKKRFAPAQASLGNLYWRGSFVEQDRTRALMWYILAQETARPDEHAEIIDRLDVMLAAASQEERIEAEARANVWSEENPVNVSQAPAP